MEDELDYEELPAVSGASSNTDELGNGLRGDVGSHDGSRRRKRGLRGGSRAGSARAAPAKARWRSGAMPSASAPVSGSILPEALSETFDEVGQDHQGVPSRHRAGLECWSS